MATQKTAKRTVKVKPAQKKSASKPAAASRGTEHRELTGLLDQLEQSEIIWLITQAKTMIYNRKVDEVNKAARELAVSRQKSGAGKKDTSGKPSGPPGSEVDIVQAGGPKNYNILTGNARLFLTLEELKALVRISQSAADPGDGGGRLYRWFKRERNDIIIDAGMSGPADPRLRKLHEILKDRFTAG